MAEGGMIFGIPAATAIRAAGYASVALIAGQSLAGMAHDGIDHVPETGTWLLKKGERVVTSSTSAKLDETLTKVQQVRQGEAKPNISVSVDARSTFTGKPDDATLLAFDQRTAALKRQIVNELTAEVHNPQKNFGRAIYSNLQAKRPT